MATCKFSMRFRMYFINFLKKISQIFFSDFLKLRIKIFSTNFLTGRFREKLCFIKVAWNWKLCLGRWFSRSYMAFDFFHIWPFSSYCNDDRYSYLSKNFIIDRNASRFFGTSDDFYLLRFLLMKFFKKTAARGRWST